ncbi:unnamed protein product [Orchesella dallaii]|uniref:Uncharacterized protein n=1 Tax=Orchesella dallaii TaxID=48710 RepID=A0ABP1QGC9_9HEXA
MLLSKSFIIFLISLAPQTGNTFPLNLSPYLKLFVSCTVHIISYEYQNENHQAEYEFQPDIEPLNFPIIKSVYNVTKLRDNDNFYNAIFVCNNNWYSLSPKQGFKFTSQPLNLKCAVQIYIELCPNLSFTSNAGDFINAPLYPEDHGSIISLHRSYYDIYARRERKNGKFTVDKNVVGFKSGIFQIAITRTLNSVLDWGKSWDKLRTRLEYHTLTNPSMRLFFIVRKNTRSNKTIISVFKLKTRKYTNYVTIKRMLDKMKLDNFKTFSDLELYEYNSKSYANLVWKISTANNNNIEFGVATDRNKKGGFKRKYPNANSELLNIFSPNFSVVPITSQAQYEAFSTGPDNNPRFYLKEFSPFVVRRTEDMRFLTCDGAKYGNLDASGYHSAYDRQTWIAVGLSCIATIVIIAKFGPWARDNTFFRFTKACLEILQVLTEQEAKLVDKSRNNTCLRCICTVWILMGIILTNAYKGKNIGDLTAPIKLNLLTRSEQLIDLNFTIYSANVFSGFIPIVDMHGEEFAREVIENFDFVPYIEEIEVKEAVLGGFFASKFDFAYLFPNSSKVIRNVNKEIRRRIHRPKSIKATKHFTIDFVYKSLSACNKTAVVHSLFSLLLMREKLRVMNVMMFKKGHTKFINYLSIGKDSLMTWWEGWDLQNIPWPAEKVTQRLRLLSDSGLTHVWGEWIDESMRRNLTKSANKLVSSTVMAHLLKHNFVIVFYQLLALLMACICILSLEMLKIKVSLAFLLKCIKRQQNISGTQQILVKPFRDIK